ncbi:hypothetical protein L914_00649, partial [Phytophthora nicotianae]
PPPSAKVNSEQEYQPLSSLREAELVAAEAWANTVASEMAW